MEDQPVRDWGSQRPRMMEWRLGEAVRAGRFEEAQALLEAAVAPDGEGARGDQRQSALCQALNRKDLKMAGLLLRAGANVNDQDDWGHSPMHWALMASFKEGLQWLQERGGNPFTRNRMSETPRELALRTQSIGMARAMESLEARERCWEEAKELADELAQGARAKEQRL